MGMFGKLLFIPGLGETNTVARCAQEELIQRMCTDITI